MTYPDGEQYNENIFLVEIVTKKTKLKSKEYFVLMVEDDFNKYERPKSDYWSFSLGFIGLECTSEKRIYISKNFLSRHDRGRGITFKALVKDARKCSILS